MPDLCTKTAVVQNCDDCKQTYEANAAYCSVVNEDGQSTTRFCTGLSHTSYVCTVPSSQPTPGGGQQHNGYLHVPIVTRSGFQRGRVSAAGGRPRPTPGVAGRTRRSVATVAGLQHTDRQPYRLRPRAAPGAPVFLPQ
ncbi:hypothetical protein HMPREF1624_03772 [Sporothrix schenckii ATCC 58251]|uniref:Uncharacterized protein n=1 Tax=Sporothrix schenckii (strain ATCC 58251 / de Perez 2211183) TaxID=1391915 RepID=U7Q133_SPOS1|nr:hypothetical protein HMPREF1624_03772 [Sporothrix schenckii ATCC 58251]